MCEHIIYNINTLISSTIKLKIVPHFTKSAPPNTNCMSHCLVCVAQTSFLWLAWGSHIGVLSQVDALCLTPRRATDFPPAGFSVPIETDPDDGKSSYSPTSYKRRKYVTEITSKMLHHSKYYRDTIQDPPPHHTLQC